MKALILAAGYGTRLYPLTQDVAKPLLLVAGKPIINYILEKLERFAALDKVFVVTNDKFFLDFKAWQKRNTFSKKIKIINDKTKDNQTRLGAIRDINFVKELEEIEDDLLVIGGDNLFDQELEGFLAFAVSRNNALSLGLYDIKNKSQASMFGVAKTNAKGRIIDFKEKPPMPLTSLIAMCLYYFPKKKLSLLSKYIKGKENKADATGDFIKWLYRQEEVFGFTFGGKWFDIGHRESFDAAQRHFGTVDK